jgi:PncC family amidohydrolase
MRSLKLAVRVGDLLRRQNLTLATAESCTGGLVGDWITDVPGSSDYYVGGVVAYSNEAKMHLLGVKSGTLRRSGAVSAATARQMAAGVRSLFGADVGVAVTGIAGPFGGTAKKPVGLVYVAVAAPDRRQKAKAKSQKPTVKIEECRFRGSRREIKEQAAVAAMGLLGKMLEQD